jgi:hypothetical protein
LKKGKDMHMLENLCIFIAKKENGLITELEEVEEGNSLFSGWRVGRGAVFQALSVFCNRPIY